MWRLDSADTWAHPELFELDEKRIPTSVAGCPPGCFFGYRPVVGKSFVPLGKS